MYELYSCLDSSPNMFGESFDDSTKRLSSTVYAGTWVMRTWWSCSVLKREEMFFFQRREGREQELVEWGQGDREI